MKFGLDVSYKMAHSKCEFHENRCAEGCSFLTGVHAGAGEQRDTVNRAYNGTVRDRYLCRCRKVPFNLLKLSGLFPYQQV